MSKEFNIINLTSIAGKIETNGAQNFVFNPFETVDRIKFDIRKSEINDDMIEVFFNLIIESVNKETNEAVYITNSVYGGVFKAVGFSEGEEMDQLVQIHCATILYPLCRERVMNLVSHTPFQISIPPVLDFGSIYKEQKHKAQEQANQEEQTETSSAD